MPSAALSTRLTFLCIGILMAAMAPLVPLAKTRLGLAEDQLGALLLCVGLGSIVAMPLSGGWAARFGPRPVLLIASCLGVCALPLIAVASQPAALAAAFLVFGAGIGTLDVVVNVQAVIVEKAAEKAMMSGFHAMFSLGGIIGAGLLTLLLTGGVSARDGCLILLGICVILMLAAQGGLLRSVGAESSSGPAFALPKGIVILLGALCFILFLAEGAALDWSGVLLTETLGVSQDRAGLGYVAFATMMTLGRLTGDRIVQRLGGQTILVVGGILAASGFLLASWGGHWLAAIVGFAMVGAGASNVVPVLFTATGAQKSMPSHLAIAAATTIGYAGILAGPALIGFVARATKLPIALSLVAALLVMVAVSAKKATASAA